MSPGRDLAVAVIESAEGPEALPVVEAIPMDEDFYDFEARYEIGRTRFVCPADLSPELTLRAQEIALATWKTLGCAGFARVDLMTDGDDLTVLEANAIPGPHRHVAAAARRRRGRDRLRRLRRARAGPGGRTRRRLVAHA